MTITYPLAVPSSPAPVSVQVAPRTVAARTESPFTLTQEIFEHQGQRWDLTVEMPPLTRDQASEWIAWALSLNGPVGTFLYGPIVEASPRGTGGGTPIVNGTNAAGLKLLSTRGWEPGETVLRAGDYFQLGSGASARLHMNLTAAVADTAGECTLNIWPRLRTTVNDGAALTLTNPKGVFRLAEMPAWTTNAGPLYDYSWSAVEAL